MDITTQASQRIERLGTSALDADARRELRSHLQDAAARHARSRGAHEIAVEDVDAALAEAGGEGALVAAFAPPPAAHPAGLPARVAAHAVDVALVYGAVMAFWAASYLLAASLAGMQGGETWWPRPQPFQIVDIDDALHALLAPGRVPTESLLHGLLVGAMLIGAPFAYFVAGDLRGRTLGKRALGLRVVRVEGGAPRLPAALARSALKASPLLAPLLLADGLLALRRRGQRATDRLVRTLVVREPRPDEAEEPAAHAST